MNYTLNSKNLMDRSGKKICALIVIYQPKIDLLTRTINSLIDNVDEVLIYQNSLVDINYALNLQFYGDGTNVGIAKAQNVLIEAAVKQKFNFALFSDQDTIYPIDFLKKITPLFRRNKNIVAVAPGWSNSLKSSEFNGFHQFDKSGKIKLCTSISEPVSISHAISSGMIIDLQLSKNVGPFDEDLFIDWVDNDWCWRANAMGYKILGDPRTLINHQLGTRSVLLFNRFFSVRSPERNYFIIRNALILMRKHKNLNIRKYLALKIIHHFIFSLLASQSKRKELKTLLKALSDGFYNKVGASLE